MAVHHTIDLWIHPEHLTMNKSFRVALLRIGIYCRRILDIVLNEIIRCGYARRCKIAAHDIHVWFVWMADGDVAVGIDDAMEV